MDNICVYENNCSLPSFYEICITLLAVNQNWIKEVLMEEMLRYMQGTWTRLTSGSIRASWSLTSPSARCCLHVTIPVMSTDWENTSLREALCRRTWDTDEMLKMSWQCGLAAWKDNYILGCIKRRLASKMRKMILPLCCKFLPGSPSL